MDQEAVGYEHDIRPLFREKDVSSMSKAFDLASYDDVRANAGKILAKLADGSMPCDGPWPEERVERLPQVGGRAWLSGLREGATRG